MIRSNMAGKEDEKDEEDKGGKAVRVDGDTKPEHRGNENAKLKLAAGMPLSRIAGEPGRYHVPMAVLDDLRVGDRIALGWGHYRDYRSSAPEWVAVRIDHAKEREAVGLGYSKAQPVQREKKEIVGALCGAELVVRGMPIWWSNKEEIGCYAVRGLRDKVGDYVEVTVGDQCSEVTLLAERRLIVEADKYFVRKVETTNQPLGLQAHKGATLYWPGSKQAGQVKIPVTLGDEQGADKQVKNEQSADKQDRDEQVKELSQRCFSRINGGVVLPVCFNASDVLVKDEPIGKGEVEIHCPSEESDYLWSKCDKSRQEAEAGDVIALNSADEDKDSGYFRRPRVPYLYRGEKKLVWDVRERAILVNGKVVGVDLSDLGDRQALALVRKHCNKIQTVVWVEAKSLYGGVVKELARCSAEEESLSLNLEGYNGTEKNLALLKQLAPKLIHLSLKNANIGDPGLKHLSGLTNLRELDVSRTQVGEAGLKYLSRFANLRVLKLERTKVGDMGLKHVRGLTNLRKLDVSWTQVGDMGLKHLSGLINLRKLNLRGTEVGDSGLNHLSGLTNLRALDLRSTQVGDAGMKHISQLTNLRWLNVKETKVTEKRVEMLKNKMPASVDY